MIENLVRTFYGRVRQDPLIGPVFDAKVRDWETHMQRLCAFWSSIASISGRYEGRPMAAHLPLPVDTPHFDRWLEIFAATAREVCPAPAAQFFLERALRIADSFELGIAAQRGEIRARRQRPLQAARPAAAGDRAAEFKSPACSMHEASDEYLGYAGKTELLGALNELLEAERAGARVALESARTAAPGPLAGTLRDLQKDEAHWCGMLLAQIKALGGAPSWETGAFHGKAMAIADLEERLMFVNRGQGWVAKKLRAILPRVRDEALHAELSAMLRSHEANIERVNAMMRARPAVSEAGAAPAGRGEA